MDGVVVRGVGVEHGRHGGGADAVTGEGWQRGVVADGAIDDLRLDGDDVQRQRVADGVVEGHVGFLFCCWVIGMGTGGTRACWQLRHPPPLQGEARSRRVPMQNASAFDGARGGGGRCC